MPSAARVNWARFRVAAVSLVALLILGTLAYLLTGGTLLEKQTTLYLYVDDATALAAGSPVRVDGIGVGKVRSVKLSGLTEPSRVVRVTVSVERDRLASIPDDSIAQLSSETLIGDKFVDISSGISSRHIQPDAELVYKSQPAMLRSIDLAQFRTQLLALEAVMTDLEQGRSPVGAFIVGEQMYADLRRNLLGLLRGIRTASDTTRGLGRALYTDQPYRAISDPLVKLDQDLARIQSGQGAAGQLLRDSAQYEQLRSYLVDLRRSLADLQGGEFVQSDRLYADWNRQVASLIRTVDEVNAGSLFHTSLLYDNLNAAAGAMRNTLREFRENPRRYLRLKLF